MASAAGNTSLSKKRHTFLSHFLPSKNLSIFRNKPSTNTNIGDISKDVPLYKSQITINTQLQQQQTPIPMCIGRSWLKKRLKRPISLDLDLVKNFPEQSIVNNSEQYQQSLNDIGTLMDLLSIYIYIYLLFEEIVEKKKQIRQRYISCKTDSRHADTANG